MAILERGEIMKRFCSRCKKEFDENTVYRMCSKCREKNRRYQRELKQREPGRPRGIDEKIQTAKKRGRNKKTSNDSLVLFEEERRAYNAEHGTKHSYGVYRAYKERGWLK